MIHQYRIRFGTRLASEIIGRGESFHEMLSRYTWILDGTYWEAQEYVPGVGWQNV